MLKRETFFYFCCIVKIALMGKKWKSRNFFKVCVSFHTIICEDETETSKWNMNLILNESPWFPVLIKQRTFFIRNLKARKTRTENNNQISLKNMKNTDRERKKTWLKTNVLRKKILCEWWIWVLAFWFWFGFVRSTPSVLICGAGSSTDHYGSFLVDRFYGVWSKNTFRF